MLGSSDERTRELLSTLRKKIQGLKRSELVVTDDMADQAAQAFHDYIRGPYAPPLSRRELGITRQAWKYALEEALKGD